MSSTDGMPPPPPPPRLAPQVKVVGEDGSPIVGVEVRPFVCAKALKGGHEHLAGVPCGASVLPQCLHASTLGYM